MKQRISLSWEKKVFPWLTMVIGVVLMLAQWIVRLNLVSVVAVAYCCILSAVIFIALLAKKKVYAPMVLGYAASTVGIIVYYVIWAQMRALAHSPRGWRAFHRRASVFYRRGQFRNAHLGQPAFGAARRSGALGAVLDRTAQRQARHTAKGDFVFPRAFAHGHKRFVCADHESALQTQH